MTRAGLACAGALAALAVAAAPAAGGRLDLRARRLPASASLRMRVAQPTAAATTTATATARPSGGARPARPSHASAARDIARLVGRDTGARTPLRDRLVLRVDIGLGVDGSRLSGAPALGGQPVLADRYDSVRSYGLADLYLGSRDLGRAGLSTYTASQLRIAAAADRTTPIPSPYDTIPDAQNRTAWIEVDDLFRSGWLAPLRVRAGRMYVYGPTIVHLDGLVAAWESSWLELSAFTGRRVPDFAAKDVTPDDSGNRGDALGGTELRADLRHYHLPLVLGASTLRFGSHSHSELTGTVVPRADVVIRSSSRFEDGTLARQRLVIRARVSEDSTIIVDNQLRTRADWFWDYASLRAAVPAGADDGDVDRIASRYLDLGVSRPRFQSALQAGTVIAQNLDLLARGAVALDLGDDARDGAPSPYLPEYVEGGAGVEVRLRRALSLTASGLVRDYKRPVPHAVDTPDAADPLPATSELGEESLIEGAAAARYTAGARRFSAQAELYGRRTRWVPQYEVDQVRPEVISLDGGARFYVDAWVSAQVRLRLEYDVTSTLDEAPELRGLKQLRLWIEGTY